MKSRTRRRGTALGIVTFLLVVIGGCPPVIGTAIAGAAFIFLLDQAGVLELSAGGGTVRTDGITALFGGSASDRPGSGTLNLNVGRTRAIARDGTSKSSGNQSINGIANVLVRMASATSSDPCGQGVQVGTFQLRITAGVVTCPNPSLDLPPAALEFAIDGEFAICLEATSDVDVRIIIEEMSVEFGPAAGGNTNANANTNTNGNANDNSGNSNDNIGNSNDNTGNANTNDNTGGNGNGNANDNDNGGDPNEIFKDGIVVHRGSEAIIAGTSANAALGFVPPEKFNIGRIAMSDDGRYVWFYLYWESVTPRPADWIRLYRIDTFGLDLQRSTISEEAEAIGGGFLASSYDGSVAVYEMQRAEPGGVFSRPESRFLSATPGNAAVAFYDTENDDGLPSGTGPRLTGDGRAIYWNNIDHLWRVATTGGVAQELATVAHLNFYGPWDPFTGGQFFGLDITADGSEWLLGVRFTEQAPPYALRYELVQAAGALPQNLNGVANQSNMPIASDTVQLSDDGTVLGYEESNAFGVGGSYVQSANYESDLRTAGAPGADGAYGQVLADNGKRAFVEVNFKNQRTPVFHDLETGTRLRAGSTRYTNNAGGVYGRQLSDDGQMCVAVWNSNAIGTPFNNIYVLRDGVDGLPGYPQFGGISYRYDAKTDSLIVRCVVTAAGGLERIYLLPLSGGVEPLSFVPDAENPFYNERYGGGVNFSTLFTPVEGLADTYERAIYMDGKIAYVDGDFRLRIIAVDATGMRTSFRDIVPVP